MNLMQFLSDEEEQILEEAFASLNATQLLHYVKAGDEECRLRLRALYDEALRSLRERSLLPIVAHSVQVGHERFATGHSLDEVLAAYDVLEEAAWWHITAALPPTASQLVLARLREVLSAGEDALATTYVDLCKAHGEPRLDLEELFEGVD